MTTTVFGVNVKFEIKNILNYLRISISAIVTGLIYCINIDIDIKIICH